MRSVLSHGAVLVAVLIVLLPVPALAQGHGSDEPVRRRAAPDTTRGAADAARDPSAGGTAPPPEELVALALRRAPSLEALRARVDEARQGVGPAGALPNPMVEVMLQDVAFPTWTVGEEEMSMIGPQVTQGIPFPGKRGARRGAARAEVAVRETELEQLRREIARAIRADYARLYALDREREALAAGHEMLDVLGQSVRDRYSTGAVEGEAVVKAQLMGSRVAEQLDDLAAERRAIVAAINRLLDRPGDAPLGEVTSLPEPVVPAPPWSDAAVEASAEVAMRRAEVTVAEQRLRMARVERRPDLIAGAGIGYRGSHDPVVTLRLGLDLPLWGGPDQGPTTRGAERGVEAARQSLRDAEARARAEAARLEARWTTAERQVARYTQSIVPQSRLALDAARSGYLVGRGDFSMVIEDFNLWLEARSGLARREAERFATWAELRELIGAAEPGAPDDDDERRER